MKNLIILLSLFIASSLFQSCSAPTSISSWVDNDYKGGVFKKVLIVALIKDDAYRKVYEEKISNALKGEGVNAVNSIVVMNSDRKYSKEEIASVLKIGNYDGLMTLKYLKTTIEKRVYPSRTYVDDYLWGPELISTPGYIEKHKSIKMEATLYSVKIKSPVWAGQSKTRDANSVQELATSLAGEIKSELKFYKMVK